MDLPDYACPDGLKKKQSVYAIHLMICRTGCLKNLETSGNVLSKSNNSDA